MRRICAPCISAVVSVFHLRCRAAYSHFPKLSHSETCVPNRALSLSGGLRSTVSAEISRTAQQTMVQVDYFLKYSDFILVIAYCIITLFFSKYHDSSKPQRTQMRYILNVHKVLNMSRNLAQTHLKYYSPVIY